MLAGVSAPPQASRMIDHVAGTPFGVVRLCLEAPLRGFAADRVGA